MRVSCTWWRVSPGIFDKTAYAVIPVIGKWIMDPIISIATVGNGKGLSFVRYPFHPPPPSSQEQWLALSIPPLS